MIYIGKVRPSIMEEGKDSAILDFFKAYKPARVQLPEDKEEQKKIKTLQLNGFISGEMKALIRKNENVLTRDCLVLDLDDVLVNEERLIEAIRERFKAFQYVLYSSISNGLKGVRYRLLLPLDESVKEQEYKLLIRFFSNKILNQIIGKMDESNSTWSQLMLLPVSTQYSKANIIVNESEKCLPVQNLLKGAKTWQSEQEPQKQVYDTTRFKRGAYRYRNSTTQLFESLVFGCAEGNRNNRIAQITGGLLARNVNVIAVHELVLFANEHFDEPLPIKEVESTFYSIARKELGVNE
ncbi:primase C-terminal domain-containing protein [Enterococcus faecium]|nr:primase C-terminal domain-containing protein [Enterococcus faecium]